MPGPTQQTYTLVGADAGANVACRVTATNSQGSVSATTPSVVPVAKEPLSTVLPVISGTLTVGQTLTATTGTWTGIPTITYAYQWRRGNASSPIDSASASTYTLTGDDTGQRISVSVTASNVYASTEAMSALTAVVTGASTAAGLQALIDHGFTWLDGRTLANGATGNWVPSTDTPGTGTAVMGTTTGSETIDPAVTGGVLTFTLGDVVSLASNAITSFTATTGEFTVFVVYRANNPVSCRLFSTESSGPKGFYLGFSLNHLRAVCNGTTVVTVNGGDPILDGVRVNVAAVCVDDGVMTCYADDQTAGSQSITGVGTIVHGSAAKLGSVGANIGSSNYAGAMFAVLYTQDAITGVEFATISAFLRDEYT